MRDLVEGPIRGVAVGLQKGGNQWKELERARYFTSDYRDIIMYVMNLEKMRVLYNMSNIMTAFLDRLHNLAVAVGLRHSSRTPSWS